MLYVVNKTSVGEDLVKAYGCVHVPVQPGHYRKEIRMYSVVEESTVADLLGYSKVSEGFSMTSYNAKSIANAEGRQYSKVKSAGTISVSVNVQQRNMGRHGYLLE